MTSFNFRKNQFQTLFRWSFRLNNKIYKSISCSTFCRRERALTRERNASGRSQTQWRRRDGRATINFETFILHQLCSLLKHFKPSAERKTNGAENSLRNKNSDGRICCDWAERMKFKKFVFAFFGRSFITIGINYQLIAACWREYRKHWMLKSAQLLSANFHVFLTVPSSLKSEKNHHFVDLRWIATFILFAYKNAC